MATRELPAHPNLENYKKQAKSLLQQCRDGDRDALNRGREHHPRLASLDDAALAEEIQLADAQFAIAREHGFDSWPKFVDAIAQPSPFAGLWIADSSVSRQHPANRFDYASIEIAVAANTVTFTHTTIAPDGARAEGTHTLAVGDAEHPGAHGYALVARWRSRHVLETIARQHGANVGGGTYEVSPDRATLTIRSGEHSYVLRRAPS